MHKLEHPVTMLKEQYKSKIKFIEKQFNDHKLQQIAPDLKPPMEELNEFFSTIDEVLLDADYAKYKRAFLRKISSLECFHLRIIDLQRRARPWNPIDESFSDFESNTGKLDYYFADTPYPPIEIIISWMNS